LTNVHVDRIDSPPVGPALGTDDVCRVVVRTLDAVMRLSLTDNQIFLGQLPAARNST